MFTLQGRKNLQESLLSELKKGGFIGKRVKALTLNVGWSVQSGTTAQDEFGFGSFAAHPPGA
jgi:hypothetical protein